MAMAIARPSYGSGGDLPFPDTLVEACDQLRRSVESCQEMLEDRDEYAAEGVADRSAAPRRTRASVSVPSGHGSHGID
jgi:hypothetical protein